MSSGHSNSGGGGSTVGDGSPGGHPVSALSVNIQKYGEDDSVGAGGLAKFKVTISNTSDIASPDVEIDIGWWRDWAGRTYAYDIAVNPSHADCFQPKRCRLGTIPAGGSKVVDINGETEAGVLTMYNFRVTATAADGATATGTIRVGSSVTLLEIGGGGATGIWSLSLLLSTWLVRGLRRPNRVLERIVAFDRVGRFAAGPIVSRSAPPRDGSPSSAGPPAGRCPLIPRHFPESS